MVNNKIVVIGAGASGMMAAGRAAESGVDVLLLEKMEHPGKKILISGKTRCNLTNTKELDDFITMYGANGNFLYPAFNHYFREDLRELLSRYGVETKTERGGRIFPVSDDAQDIVKAFERYLTDNKVRIQTGVSVNKILVEKGQITGVQARAKIYPAAAVILAAGGASFPATGSTGDGYRMASAIGHTIVPLRPSLVPLVVNEIERAKSMQGVSLRNVRLTAFQCGADEIDASRVPSRDTGRGITGKHPQPPVIESRMGDMMFTHFGIGGPITLQMSLAVVDALAHGPVSVAIDLKPALSYKELSARLQRDFDHYGKRNYRNLLKELLPQKLIEPFVAMTGIPPEKCGHEITAEERGRLLSSLKSLRFNIKSSLPLTSAMVTAGGISLKEIDPRTMASRLVKGLYFCGEVMDIDAETGGYNLQAAFSTGYVAGESAANDIRVISD
ncbi:MAG: NAD(P)/FAD-dependent oxidoreductase [Dehalococcoidales bacterium]|nr:NAD(P)/FAD-dependent oxidoreductase [Dehalococcoidales bacterium]